ncbi:hypothetical protein [Microbacterium rhizomatis]|uniref:Uncharacterized protein n=1 Tax=Microbacterium rhizomatis TaxID=1631477 RepID=A0A5J5J1E2_9MICO|nr:hypothetical protein [Microbacterium rhizomatis]KAA9107814.1 hypothetical protein F6B43_10270 [Microbacterium rhizomatis]
MKRKGIALAGTAAVLITVAGLAVPAAAEEIGAATEAPKVQEAMGDTREITVTHMALKPSETFPLFRKFQCPSTFPYLEGKNYSGEIRVPSGVRVGMDSPSVHVNISLLETRGKYIDGDDNWRATGWRDALAEIASVTNWDPFFSHMLTITVSCTSDPAKGFGSNTWPEWHTGWKPWIIEPMS